MTKSTIGLSVGLLGLFSPETRAQDDAPIDANQIALDPTGTGLLTIGNGTLLEPGHVHAHAVLQHLSQPVVRERVTGSARTLLVPRREQVDLAFSAGLMDRLQVYWNIPKMKWSRQILFIVQHHLFLMLVQVVVTESPMLLNISKNLLFLELIFLKNHYRLQIN